MEKNSKAIIKCNDLVKLYKQGEKTIYAVNNCNISVRQGEFVAVIGKSGSGKSTLLSLMAGFIFPTRGSVFINDRNIGEMNDIEISKFRSCEMGFIFQSYNLIPNLTVRENVEICEMLGNGTVSADKIIADLGLSEHKNKFPRHLSGGQQQRTAIARALVKNPEILLCDEPTGALDYETSKEALAALEQIHKLYKTTIIIVTHNEAISQMADQVIRLRDGRVYKELFNEKTLSASEIDW